MAFEGIPSFPPEESTGKAEGNNEEESFELDTSMLEKVAAEEEAAAAKEHRVSDELGNEFTMEDIPENMKQQDDGRETFNAYPRDNATKNPWDEPGATGGNIGINDRANQ